MSTDGELSGAKATPKPDLFAPNRKDSEVRRAYPKDPHGWFVEEEWCTQVMVEFERRPINGTLVRPFELCGIPSPVWDPACGQGNIPRALVASGIEGVVCTDLIDRGFGEGGWDFLATPPRLPEPTPRAIVTNPPYGRLAERFILRALEVVPYVAVLVQAKFAYSQGRYERLWRDDPPSREIRFVDRPSMPPGRLLGKLKAKGGKMDFYWAIWDRRSTGPTTAHWIRKPGR